VLSTEELFKKLSRHRASFAGHENEAITTTGRNVNRLIKRRYKCIAIESPPQR